MAGDSRQHLPNWFTCTTCAMSFVCCENILTKSIFYSWHSGYARIRILMLCALFLSHLPSLNGVVCGFGGRTSTEKCVRPFHFHFERPPYMERNMYSLRPFLHLSHPNWIFPIWTIRAQLFRSPNTPIKPELLWNCWKFYLLLMLRE